MFGIIFTVSYKFLTDKKNEGKERKEIWYAYQKRK